MHRFISCLYPADVAPFRYTTTATSSIMPTRAPNTRLVLYPAATVGARNSTAGICGRGGVLYVWPSGGCANGL